MLNVDVSGAFRHLEVNAEHVARMGAMVKFFGVTIIDMSAPFGWTGSPGFYKVIGGAISYVEGSTTNEFHPAGFFNYHWVDNHANAAIRST